MQITIQLAPDLNLDETHMGIAMAGAKIEQNPKLISDGDADIQLHAPSKKFLGTLYIREK